MALCEGGFPSLTVFIAAIGEPFWCAVHKCESSSAATTLRISSKNEHIKTLKIDEINSLDELMPGMKVDFIIDKVGF